MHSIKNIIGDLSLYSPSSSGASMPISFSDTDFNLPVQSAEMTESSFHVKYTIDEDILNVSHVKMSRTRKKKMKWLLPEFYSKKDDFVNGLQPGHCLPSPDRQTNSALPPSTSTSTGLANNNNDVTKEIKMGGARRKRYKLLTSHGFSKEEAILKSAYSMQVIISLIKNPSRNSFGVKSHKVKRKPASTFLQNKKNKISKKLHNPSNPIMKKEISVEIGIFPAAFPEIKFQKEQFEALQDCLSEHILKETFSMPQFCGTTCKNGWLQITCANMTAVEWLRNTVPSLKPWRDARLTILEEKDFPKPMNLVCFLPKSSTISDDCILDYLHKQNPKNLDVRLWKMLYREDSSDMTKAIINIDGASALLLTKDGAKLYYMLSSVNFIVINDNGKPMKQAKRENVAGSSRYSTTSSRNPLKNNHESRLENKLLHFLDGPKIKSNDFIIPDTKERFEKDWNHHRSHHNYEDYPSSSLRNVEQEILLLSDQLRDEKRALELELEQERRCAVLYSPRERSQSPRRYCHDDRECRGSNSLSTFPREH